ncbi:mechanosensitive ion channel family protein [Actinomadura alba]|uniref:Mechanosensitive ion channel n=1 Tax=Actinomadura alba TaxID=406431 RepID=A0ABR7LSD0_9ACTN|nr:mechanosensitive ion channel domain-containing protein [Actinomadura alba]MBC6467732.1 mechanosensitive ion channel [Actinomadura alba]
MSPFHQWAVLAATVTAAVVAVEVVRRLLAGPLSRRRPGMRAAARRCAYPGFATAVVVSVHAALPTSSLGVDTERIARHALWIGVIGTTTWLVLRIAYALTDPALTRLGRVEGERNRRARRAQTQMLLLRRIASAIVVVLAVGTALFTFPAVRALGAGVLASAGVAGLVVGIAARPMLGNLFAGIQLAFSDALRLDDVVVVEGEWGRIEELTLSNVVVRTWDERRLILPVSYFAENPFENWTRHESRVIGSVLIHVDWAVPVDDLRKKLHEFLSDHPLWDRREWVLQVTEVLPNGLIQLRALMSAADSASAWDLRCDVRERLVSYIRDEHPDALPRFRADMPEPDPTP